MAKIELFIEWSGDGVLRNDGSEDYELWSGDVFVFDTVLRTVSSSRQYQNVYSTPVQDTPPATFSLDNTVLLSSNVSGPTQFRYYHGGNGSLNIEQATLTLTALVTGSTCFGGRNGSIALLTTGLPGPYTFLWEDGPTTRDRGPLPAATYRVRVEDLPTGAIARATVQVGANAELVVVIQKAGGDVALQVSGGTAPYTYLWSDESAQNTDRDRTGLVTGPYSCTITDALGCTKEVNLVVDADQFFWSRNPITLALDAGNEYRADPTTKPNLTFICEVFIEKQYLSGDFEQVGGVLEQPADRNGRTVFEVQALLDVFLDYHVPVVGATGLVRADPMFRRFYLQHAESFGTPAERTGTSVLLQNYVVRGGLNFYESRSPTFDAYQAQVMPFLTWEPPVKAALPDQPEFLYYLVRKSLAGFRFRARVFYTDGTSEVMLLGGQDNVRLHEVYCQPVGYHALGLAALAGERQVQQWEVFVTTPDGGELLSEVRTYVLDRQYFPNRGYFLFATSLGGMATYAATGEPLLDAEVKGEESALSLTPDYDPLLGDTAVQTRELRPVLKVAGGKRTRAQMLASQDLLLSRRVLLLQNGRWVPGYLKAKTVTVLDKGKPVPTQEFEFYQPTEQLYTPALGASQVTYALPS